NKDQTYFMWGIERDVVRRMITPVGGLTKEETRAAARQLGLVTADKKESVDICFVPDGDYPSVLARHLGAETPALAPGPFLNTAGDVVGSHDGYARYTIGQRKGLPGGYANPMFVVAIQPEQRAVVIGTADELYGHRAELEEMNWLVQPLSVGDECELQIRYRSQAVPARVVATNGRLELELNEPARAITPGQSGVIYDGDKLLGGGVLS
ncbi:MAG: aminomethyltransferase beta-barrel domain-containing protein, partial [Gemmatimonadales bacterium]